ncbi:Hsp33 family molecular chaperone HslO [Tuberibacillus sp. Marseille-P3662]|uniref:Hsp33 family molecular chaperone HslO n=1 Tax=Tuberibacillus sp. Marseille-P3662 TaxID=1965358 RepID=UPI000A1CA3F8|nr:Hsp33 family molecular chaperone HslO [Tuberibacillus sp. Marseille-P3662]
MGDYLVKALAFNGHIRAQAIISTDMVSEAQRRHNTWPTASAAMGRTITAATMMGVQLKGQDKLTVTVEGGGPIGVIIADATSDGVARGYVTNPQVHFDLNEKGKLDVARAVGNNGHLSVVKDLGMRENFTGRVPLVSGEIGDDFTYYFVHSEQIPSAVGVGVLVNPDNTIKASGGFLIQVLPGAPDDIINQVEERLTQVKPISKMIEEGLTPEDILTTLFSKDDVQFIDKMGVTFECTCSKERLSNALLGMGPDELRSMIDEDHGAEASCHFCRTTYHFSESELEDIYQRAKDTLES